MCSIFYCDPFLASVNGMLLETFVMWNVTVFKEFQSTLYRRINSQIFFWGVCLFWIKWNFNESPAHGRSGVGWCGGVLVPLYDLTIDSCKTNRPWVMLRIHKSAQLCVITNHLTSCDWYKCVDVTSCDWCKCNGGPCGNAFSLIITRYVASCGTKLCIFLCDWCKCNGGLCGNTPVSITTRHVASCDTKLCIFLCPAHYSKIWDSWAWPRF